MKLVEIFNSFEGSEIIKTIINLYPNQAKNIEGYERMIIALRDINPNPEPQTMSIEVSHFYQDWDFKEEPDDYISVHGKDPAGFDEQFPDMDPMNISWAIEYLPWADWLSWELTCTCPDDPRCDTYLKLLAHCIWEMSWAGYQEEDIKEQFDMIVDTAKRIDDGTEELIEWSSGDVFKDLGIEKPQGFIKPCCDSNGYGKWCNCK